MFAPVAFRELVVASRLPISWRIRLAMTLGALIIAFFALASPRSLTSAGQYLFGSLAILTFIYTLFAGFIFTSTSITEERREGTFGLLYLTPLSSWDVISGKLASTSLQAFFGLIAIVPVFALSWLAGGVTATNFVRVILALIGSLLLSLSAGMFASASARSRRGAIGMTAFLILATLIGGWVGVIIAAVLSYVSEQEKKKRANFYWFTGYGFLSLFLMWMVRISDLGLVGSPAQTLRLIWTGSNISFLASAAALYAIAAFYLFSAALCTEWFRAAREIVLEKEDTEGHIDDIFFPGLRSKGRVGDDPAQWLLSFLQSPPLIFYISVALILLVSLAGGQAPAVSGLPTTFIFFWAIPYLLFNFAISRFCSAPFAILERSGFAETLHTTPLRPQDLIRAQRRILWRTMRLPFIFMLLASLPGMIRVAQFWFTEAGFTTAFPPGFYILQWILGWFLFALSIEAVCMVAMRNGLQGRKPFNAGLRTIALVILPQLFLNMIFYPFFWALGSRAFSQTVSLYFIQFLPSAFTLVFFLVILRWARRSLGLRPSFLDP